MKKISIYLIILLVLTVNLSSLQVKGPLLILGAGDEDEDNSKLPSNYKIHDIFRVSDAQVVGDTIFVLERTSSLLFSFNMKGELLGKKGGIGGGWTDFYEPSSIEVVGQNLWIVDTNNVRIQEYNGLEYKKTIRIPKVPSPRSLAVSGECVLVARTSFAAPIAVFDKKGNYKFPISFKSRYISKDETGLFHIGTLVTLPGNRILMGFKFYPIIAIIEPDLKTIHEYDMSAYYSLPKPISKNGVTYPNGHTSSAFAAGPGNTILIAACEKKDPKFHRVIQISTETGKKIGEWDTGIKFLRMHYNRAKNLLTVVNQEFEVMIYEIH